MSRGRILAALVALSLANGLYRVGREMAPSGSEALRQSRDRREFLAEWKRRIPPGVTLHVRDEYDVRLSAAELYPWPVRPLKPVEAAELRAREPAAWVIWLPVPFRRERAYVGFARDLP